MSLRSSGEPNTTRISSSSVYDCNYQFPPVSSFSALVVALFLDSLAPPSELLEMCELSLEKMGAIFADTNVYMLHMMYQAMGVCLYMQDWDGAMSYGEKIIQPYR